VYVVLVGRAEVTTERARAAKVAIAAKERIVLKECGETMKTSYETNARN